LAEESLGELIMKVQKELSLQAFVQGMLGEVQRRQLDLVRETLLRDTKALDAQREEGKE